MGKQSKRRQQTAPKPENSPDPELESDEIIYKGTRVKMPPTRPNWKTFAQANRELEAMGWRESMFAPDFTSTELVHEVLKILEKKGTHVVDATNVVPDGPNADWSVWPLAGFDLNKHANASPNTAFLVLRTKKNTPGFLGGTLYGYAAQFGGMKAATDYVKEGSTTPCGMIMFNGHHFMLPTVLSQGTPKLAAKIIAAMIERDDGSFTCAVCMESFLRVEDTAHGGQVLLSQFVATECDHAFHSHCIIEHFKAGGKTCPTCRSPLPIELRPDGEKANPRSNDPFRQPKSIGRLNPKNPADKSAIMNMLSDRVRDAMLADGLAPPEDAPRFQ